MKTKDVKRKEALIRQRDHLLKVAIPAWCNAGDFDKVTKRMVDARLVSSAYSARCDRRGNYLDYRYYHTSFNQKRVIVSYSDDFHNAVNCDVLSLEEMKNYVVNGGQTLYEIAYGT